MTPWLWRLGAGFSALGALAIAPCLASGLILFSLRLPLSGFEPGLWHDYWQVLDQPAYRPYATRIRFWGGAGLVSPPLLWCAAMLALWRRRRSLRSPPPHVPFDRLETSALALPTRRPGAIPLTKRHGRTLAAPEGVSVLVSAPFYPEAHAVVIDTLRRSTGATLVVDCGGRSHAYARPGRGRTVWRLCPFGGGNAWNPLAGAWGAHGLDQGELRELAAVWFPDAGRHDRFLGSHVRNAFISLVHVIHAVVQGADEADVPVAPGDLYRLCAQGRHFASPGAFVRELARRPEIGSQARHGLEHWLALGDAGVDTVWARVTGLLATFSDPVVDAATRGGGLASASLRQTDVYLDIPDRWRTAAGPLIASAIRQWQNTPAVDTSSLLVVHALDTLPRIDALMDHAAAWRCIATTRGIAAVRARYGHAAPALGRRFTTCVVHAPREETFAHDESEALKAFIAAQHENPHLLSAPASARELMSLCPGEQIVSTASLRTPVVCRTLTLPRKPNAAPPQTDHGEPMPIPRPLIAFLATLVASSNGASEIATSVRSTDSVPHGVLVPATIGTHRFAFPKNLYYQQSGPDASDGVMLGVQWPALEPLPQGVDYHANTASFISHINIDISAASRLSDDQYKRVLQRYIEPINPENESAKADPSQNLNLRIKGDPTFGLTPYLADFDKLKPYYDKVHGPGSPAIKPEHNDDWFVRMGADGIPTTVIICSSRLLPDGVKIVDGRIVDDDTPRRSTCFHSFLIPELRLVVDMSYLRAVMHDWQRIESKVRSIIQSGEVK